MYEGRPNPTQVQFAPAGKAADAPLPLVLIHDGGGTTFSYFLLGNLSRDVWAIHNPRYFDGLSWEGGMDEMARTYLEFLKNEEISGPVILGGWSLGGFLSVKMAHLVALNPDAYSVSIAGLLIIDSPHHIARSKITQTTCQPQLNNMPDLVCKSFGNCDVMLQHWDLPQWAGSEPRTLRFTIKDIDFKLPPSQVLYKPAAGGASSWEAIATTNRGVLHPESSPAIAPGSPPPGVLIRCTKPSKPKGKTGVPCLVDLHRDKKLLGWEGQYADFIKAVIDVDADHYHIFDRMDMDRMEDVTARLGWGLEVLDALVG